MQITESETQVARGIPVDLGKDVFISSNGVVQIRKIVKVGSLKDGKYNIKLEFSSVSKPDLDNSALERQIEAKKYAWENTPLGNSDIIVPPFTPLQVTGNKVSCLLRDYIIGKNGLPAEIIADQKQILSKPVQVKMVMAGKEVAWHNKPLKWGMKSPTQVKYSSSSQAQDLEMRVNGKLEYDGFLLLNIELIPNTTSSIDRFYLDIPVKKEIAQLYHAIGERVRNNPAGNIPAGKGVVWKSRNLPQEQSDNFVPYVWVGEESRGICYVADWDKNWVHSEKHDAVELIRTDEGNIVIRVNMISDRVLIGKPQNYEIAIMASPVKTMPEGWRGWTDGYGSFHFPGNRMLQCLYCPPYWGSFYGWMARYPRQGKFEFLQELKKTFETGVVNDDFINSWSDSVEKNSKATNT